MRAGAFADLRVIRLINRRFIPFYFNTGGPGLGHDDDADKFIRDLQTESKRFRNLKVITDPYGRRSNTFAYFAAFSQADGGKILGIANGWNKGEKRVRQITPNKKTVFEFLLKMLRDNPEFDKWTEAEQKILTAAKENPTNAQAVIRAATIREELGQYDQAIKNYRQALQHAKTNKKPIAVQTSVYAALLRIARYKKDWESQQKILAEIKSAPSDLASKMGADLTLEQAYRKLDEKDYRGASKLLTKAIKNFPDSKRMGELQYYAGVASFFLKDKPSAYYHWCWIVENIPDDHLARRAYISAAHEDFPYPNYELGGFKTNRMIGTRNIINAYRRAKTHYEKRVKAEQEKAKSRK